jgi:hypothetical protein
MHAAMNTTMNVLYAGNQNSSTIGTLTNKSNKVQSGSSAAVIAGAVIGSILGCFMLIVVASLIIFVITWTKRSVNVKKPRRSSFKMHSSPADLQSELEPAIITDIKQPLDTWSPANEQENAEQVYTVTSNNQAMTAESISPVNNQEFLLIEDQQKITESTSIQEEAIIEENKARTSIEEVLLDVSDNLTSTDDNIAFVEQENTMQ